MNGKFTWVPTFYGESIEIIGGYELMSTTFMPIIDLGWIPSGGWVDDTWKYIYWNNKHVT
jgi:hypothetical protein